MRMRYGLTVSTPPNAEPVSTAEAKTHLRVDGTDEDTYIDKLIAVARRHVEHVTRRALITQSVQMTLDHFPGVAHGILDLRMHPERLTGTGEDWVIRLPRGPVQSVTSITYTDDAGAEQTLAPSKYILDAAHQPARITPAYTEVWPTTRPIPAAVTVEFVAGYGNPADVPDDLKHAVLVLVATMHEHREAVAFNGTPSRVPMAFDYLVGPYRLGTVAGS